MIKSVQNELFRLHLFNKPLCTAWLPFSECFSMLTKPAVSAQAFCCPYYPTHSDKVTSRQKIYVLELNNLPQEIGAKHKATSASAGKLFSKFSSQPMNENSEKYLTKLLLVNRIARLFLQAMLAQRKVLPRNDIKMSLETYCSMIIQFKTFLLKH